MYSFHCTPSSHLLCVWWINGLTFKCVSVLITNSNVYTLFFNLSLTEIVHNSLVSSRPLRCNIVNIIRLFRFTKFSLVLCSSYCIILLFLYSFSLLWLTIYILLLTSLSYSCFCICNRASVPASPWLLSRWKSYLCPVLEVILQHKLNLVIFNGFFSCISINLCITTGCHTFEYAGQHAE